MEQLDLKGFGAHVAQRVKEQVAPLRDRMKLFADDMAERVYVAKRHADHLKALEDKVKALTARLDKLEKGK